MAGINKIAFHDISEYLKEIYPEYDNKKSRGFIVGVGILDTKEQRRLNRELGLHKINHLGNKNGFNKSNI